MYPFIPESPAPVFHTGADERVRSEALHRRIVVAVCLCVTSRPLYRVVAASLDSRVRRDRSDELSRVPEVDRHRIDERPHRQRRGHTRADGVAHGFAGIAF